MALKKSLQAVKTGSKNLTALDFGCGSGNVTEIYKKYEELCSDTRLMVFRKGLA